MLSLSEFIGTVRREYLDRDLILEPAREARELQDLLQPTIGNNSGLAGAATALTERRAITGNSKNFSHIPGDNIARVYFRPQLPPGIGIPTETRSRIAQSFGRRGRRGL